MAPTGVAPAARTKTGEKIIVITLVRPVPFFSWSVLDVLELELY